MDNDGKTWYIETLTESLGQFQWLNSACCNIGLDLLKKSAWADLGSKVGLAVKFQSEDDFKITQIHLI